jgi:hypothetical protein
MAASMKAVYVARSEIPEPADRIQEVNLRDRSEEKMRV